MLEVRERRARTACLVMSDVLSLTLAAGVALTVHDALTRTADGGALSVFVEAATIGVACLALVRLYAGTEGPDRLRRAGALVRACVYGLAIQTIVNFAIGEPASRAVLVLLWALAVPLIGVDRWLTSQLLRKALTDDRERRKALVIGADANGIALARQLAAQASALQVVGFLDDYHQMGSPLLPGATVVGRPRDLRRVCADLGVRDVIVMPQALPWESLNHVVTDSVNVDGPLRVHIGAGFYELVMTAVQYSPGFGVPLLTIKQPRLTALQSLVKTSLDCTIAVGLLTAFAPVLAVIAIRQRVRGQPRVIARQRVLGRSGTEFELLSLDSTAPIESTFVRKLPGLVNVLRGQLAIVGPRPLPVEQRAAQSPAAAHLRPGLTGPWRESEDPAEQVLLDLYYVRAFSVGRDLQVMARRMKVRLPARRRPLEKAKGVVSVEVLT